MKNYELQQQVGEKISQLRKAKGIKAETVAKHLTISAAAYSNMETGKVDLKLCVIQKILNFLQVDMDNLFINNNEEINAVKVKLFEDHQDEVIKLNRIINILVCRNEYLIDQVNHTNAMRVA